MDELADLADLVVLKACAELGLLALAAAAELVGGQHYVECEERQVVNPVLFDQAVRKLC